MSEHEQPDAVCAACGEKLQAVRPGKWQHVGECKPKPAQKSTPLPWEVTPDGFRIWSAEGHKIVAVLAHNNNERTLEARENAELIVRCVNVPLAAAKEKQ